MSAPRTMRGFTLTELLIVVVLVSILTAIALPSYRQYVIRTNRTVAKAALAELAIRQESYAVDHKAYATQFSRLNVAGATDTAFVNPQGFISSSDVNAVYTLTLTGATARAYTLNATVFATRPADTLCGTLSLSHNGTRGQSTGTAANCWGR